MHECVSSEGGTLRSGILAVSTLLTSSNLVDCTIAGPPVSPLLGMRAGVDAHLTVTWHGAFATRACGRGQGLWLQRPVYRPGGRRSCPHDRGLREYAMWAEATEAIQKYGSMVKSPSGYPVQSPYVSIANRQTEIMMRIASEFGFTPASRSRISTPSADERTLFDLIDDRNGG